MRSIAVSHSKLSPTLKGSQLADAPFLLPFKEKDTTDALLQKAIFEPYTTRETTPLG
jgi:hypothetical protein